jgi:hypothetical protein
LEQELDKEAGKILTTTLENAMHVKKKEFDPVGWFPRDIEKELNKT